MGLVCFNRWARADHRARAGQRRDLLRRRRFGGSVTISAGSRQRPQNQFRSSSVIGRIRPGRAHPAAQVQMLALKMQT